MERTECMTIIVTSAGETSWILSRCETGWFCGAGMLQALPSACLPSVWFQVFQQSPWNWWDYSCAWYSPCAPCPAGPGRLWEVAQATSLLSIVNLTPLQNENWIFAWQMPCRIFETLVGTKLIAMIPCWIMCTWCHQAHCNPWARAMVFSTKQVLAKQLSVLSSSFLNHVKHVPFSFPTGQAYNVWKCCTFSET